MIFLGFSTCSMDFRQTFSGSWLEISFWVLHSICTVSFCLSFLSLWFKYSIVSVCFWYYCFGVFGGSQ
uniref:Uncharacterized protein n=1 Tax=Cannabis sativa TaxID=3483 RepID=A0A803R047_CANSA